MKKITSKKELKELNTWQPIESAPKDGTRIIGYEPEDSIYGGIMGIEWIPEKIKKWNGSEIKLYGYWGKSVHKQVVVKPTHWIPLPWMPLSNPSKTQ